MLGKPQNKSMTPTEHLSAKVQRAIELRTLEYDLDGTEANEVGRAVALAAERASKPAYMREGSKYRAMLQPTEAEQAAIDAAMVDWEAARVVRAGLNAKLMASGQREYDAAASGKGYDLNVAQRAQEQQAALRAQIASQDLEVARLGGLVGAARGRYDAAAKQRKRAFVARMR